MQARGFSAILSEIISVGRRKRVVVTAAGNEANARHHFQGRIIGEMEHEDAEITVEENTKGFLWNCGHLHRNCMQSP